MAICQKQPQRDPRHSTLSQQFIQQISHYTSGRQTLEAMGVEKKAF